MIKPQDLRIGNLVIDCQEVKTINKDHFYEDEYCNNLQGVYPIPLTKEWLVRLGFEKRKRFDKVKHGESVFTWNKGYDFILNLEKFDNEDSFCVCFKYQNTTMFIRSVNQLQNLYFSLTNKELTIKP
jgi:hypothetical protein